MKTLLLSAGLFVVSVTAIAQVPKVQVPSKASVEKQAENQQDLEQYDYLYGKDVVSVMQSLNMKDSVGKTMYAYIPQAEKDTKFLLLMVPRGDQLIFKNNKMMGVLPK